MSAPEKQRIEQEFLAKMINHCKENIIDECFAIHKYNSAIAKDGDYISKEIHTLQALQAYVIDNECD